ncbi:hypothetical protein [Bradyrhizobium diazoefficiens]|uniref:hypothetical protein n=1 Tax=Bradyrhizobium diazoefficiens TaxID=1355477 RepID=UPI002714E1AF|nr:hypothetical protein [Bradyrhizobium diazoefficiens]WLC16297.1 hypothetical protein QIH76_40565 [Bradyrhizobium diazoefficiens]
MSQFADYHSSEDGQLRLNERQAWRLLDIDGLLIRFYRGSLNFGEDRLTTALRCYQAAAITGIFGSHPRYLHEYTSQSQRTSFPATVLDRETLTFIEDDKSAFPKVAAFLDLVSEWVGCDDIYAFLSGPSARHPTPLEQILISVEKRTSAKSSVDGRGRFSEPLMGELILNGVDTDRSFTGFLRYVDLAVDLHSFVEDGDDRSIDWFSVCMSRWFEDRFVERASTILSLFEPRTARRTRAVQGLGLLTHRYP